MVDIKLKIGSGEGISRKTADLLIQIIEAQVIEPAAKPKRQASAKQRAHLAKARAQRKPKKASDKSDFNKSDPKPGLKVLKNAKSGGRRKTHNKKAAQALALEMDTKRQGASGRPPKHSFVQWVTWAYETASVAAIMKVSGASKQTVMNKLSQITDSTGISFRFVKN